MFSDVYLIGRDKLRQELLARVEELEVEKRRHPEQLLTRCRLGFGHVVADL